MAKSEIQGKYALHIDKSAEVFTEEIDVEKATWSVMALFDDAQSHQDIYQ